MRLICDRNKKRCSPQRDAILRSRVKTVAQVVPILQNLFLAKKARAYALDPKMSTTIIDIESTRSDDSPSICADRYPTSCPCFMEGLVGEELTSHVPTA
jgi:hypothetical protein